MLDYSQNPASYNYRAQGFSLQKLSKSVSGDISIYGYVDDNIGVSYLDLVFTTGKLQDENKVIAAMLSRLFPYLKTSNGDTLFELLEFYGAQFSYESSSTHSSIKLYALSKDFYSILDEVNFAVKHKNWEKSSFEHCQNTLKRDVKTHQLEKQTVSDKTFNTHFYQGTKLANSLLLADITTVTSNDIVGKFDSLLGNVDFALTVNIDTEQLNLTSFEPGGKRELISNLFPNREVKVFPKLNKEQSIIQSVTPLCVVKSTEYPLYYFYNQILGGSFQSILSQEIREKQGLTYGIHSSLLAVNNFSYLKINSTTPYQKGAEVLIKVDQIISNFESFVNDEYLDQIKKIASAGFLKNMENIFSQLALQKNILLSELEPEFYSELLEGIKNVSKADLLTVNEKVSSQPILKIIIE